MRMQHTESSRFFSVVAWFSFFLDCQDLRAARFPQLQTAELVIWNPLADWPKAVIRISIGAARGAVGGACTYSHSWVARIQHLVLIKRSTCVWLAPATLRQELFKSLCTRLLQSFLSTHPHFRRADIIPQIICEQNQFPNSFKLQSFLLLLSIVSLPCGLK